MQFKRSWRRRYFARKLSRIHKLSNLHAMVEYIFEIFVIFVAAFFLFGKWKEKKNPTIRLPPSLPVLPLVGSLPFLRGFDNIANFFMEKSQKLGPVFTLRVGSKLVLTLNNKEVLVDALVKKSRAFSNKPDMFMQKVSNPNRKGLTFADMSPEFRRTHQNALQILREFGFGDKSVMEERILSEIEAMIDFARKKGGRAFNPREMSLVMASNVMMKILFGSRSNYELGISELIFEVEQYAHHLNFAFDVAPFLKFIPPFKGKISAMKICQEKMYTNIESEIDKCLQRQEKCFTSEYINREGPNYDRDQLNYVLRDLIVAGTDTTATTFRWALIVFANRPEIQKKLQDDIDSVIGKERLPTLQDQSKLPYVEATIQELFRWRILVPLALIRLMKEDIMFKDFFIPAGTIVLPNLYAVHTDPSIWKDPDVFQPERFLDKDNKLVGMNTIIPFSLGKRSCLGEILGRAEIFLLLTSFLQQFTARPPEGLDKVCDKPQSPVDIVAFPTDFSIRFMERQ